MDLSDYFAILRKRAALLLVVASVVLGGVTAWTLLSPRTFTATAQLFVQSPKADTQGAAQLAQLLQSHAISYVALATSPEVLIPVSEQLGGNPSPSELESVVKASAAQGTFVVSIEATGKSPLEAVKIANLVAYKLIASTGQLSKESAIPVQAVVFSMASPEFTEMSPSVGKNLIAGLIAGSFFAVLAVFVRELTDSRIRRARDIELLDGAELLAEVPVQGKASGSEHFRYLRARLGDGSAQHLVTVAATPKGEAPLANLLLPLAESFARTGASVLVIDADTRRPTLHSAIGLEAAPGLTEVLQGAPLDSCVRSHGDVHVLTSGETSADSALLLDLPACRDLVHEARLRYDRVFIAASPVLKNGDALVLSRLADQALLVAQTNRTLRSDLVKSAAELQTVDAGVHGTVLLTRSGR
ncbi:MAG: Wzz/FepE/Etk N-terminal domain-containing protein [Propionibacteriaceae bacterium]|nr:Wzz/FepE/Etk N-terminal domain-containing protein [Propionibacteriaceae bacterium]